MSLDEVSGGCISGLLGVSIENEDILNGRELEDDSLEDEALDENEDLEYDS